MKSEEFHHNFNFSMSQHCSIADADFPVTTDNYDEVEKLIKQLQIAIAKLRRKPPDKAENTNSCKTAPAPEATLTPDTTTRTGIGVAETIPDLTDTSLDPLYTSPGLAELVQTPPLPDPIYTSSGLAELVQTALSHHPINASPDLTDTSSGLAELVQTAFSPDLIGIAPEPDLIAPDPKTNCTSSGLAELAQTPADFNTPLSSPGLAQLVQIPVDINTSHLSSGLHGLVQTPAETNSHHLSPGSIEPVQTTAETNTHHSSPGLAELVQSTLVINSLHSSPGSSELVQITVLPETADAVPDSTIAAPEANCTPDSPAVIFVPEATAATPTLEATTVTLAPETTVITFTPANTSCTHHQTRSIPQSRGDLIKAIHNSFDRRTHQQKYNSTRAANQHKHSLVAYRNRTFPRKQLYNLQADQLSSSTRTSHLTERGLRSPCLHCAEPDHSVPLCPALTSQERFTIARNNKLCYTCSKAGHFSNDCPEPLKCYLCKGEHNPFICPETQNLIHSPRSVNQMSHHRTSRKYHTQQHSPFHNATAESRLTQIKSAETRIAKTCSPLRSSDKRNHTSTLSSHSITCREERNHHSSIHSQSSKHHLITHCHNNNVHSRADEALSTFNFHSHSASGLKHQRRSNCIGHPESINCSHSKYRSLFPRDDGAPIADRPDRLNTQSSDASKEHHRYRSNTHNNDLNKNHHSQQNNSYRSDNGLNCHSYDNHSSTDYGSEHSNSDDEYLLPLFFGEEKGGERIGNLMMVLGDPTAVTTKPFDRHLYRMIPVFTGDPLDWPEFYSQFKTAVHNTDLEPLFKLANLREKLDDKSKHYIRNMSSASYDMALKLLEERYSSPAHIQLYIEDYVRQLPRTDENQLIADTQTAVDRLRSVNHLIQQHHLDNSFEMDIFRAFTLRIPRSMVDKYVKTLRGKPVSLDDFIKTMDPLMDKRRTDPMYYPDLRQSNQEFNYYSPSQAPYRRSRTVRPPRKADQQKEADHYDETDQHEETDHSEEADQFDEDDQYEEADHRRRSPAHHSRSSDHRRSSDDHRQPDSHRATDFCRDRDLRRDYHQSPNHHRSARSNRRADHPRYARAVDQQDSYDEPHPSTSRDYDSPPNTHDLRWTQNDQQEEEPDDLSFPCSNCEAENHTLPFCPLLDAHERFEIARDNYLCFSCLGEGHQSYNCRHRIECGNCGLPHSDTICTYDVNSRENTNRNQPDYDTQSEEDQSDIEPDRLDYRRRHRHH